MEVTALDRACLSLRSRVTVSGRDLIILMFSWPKTPCDIQYADFAMDLECIDARTHTYCKYICIR